jgi:hypothetical protein
MTAIDNIRRDIREASWLRYSAAPFAGAVHNFSCPLRKRLESREYVGPYYFEPAKPGTGRGFYQASRGLACGDGTFSLRLEWANDHLSGSRLSNIDGYFCDPDGDGDTLKPIVARLPHGRGFLAGWTMGNGMAASMDATIWETIEDAARAAHDLADHDAENERDYQESHDRCEACGEKNDDCDCDE